MGAMLRLLLLIIDSELILIVILIMQRCFGYGYYVGLEIQNDCNKCVYLIHQ